jgi:hypothetical protein
MTMMMMSDSWDVRVSRLISKIGREVYGSLGHRNHQPAPDTVDISFIAKVMLDDYSDNRT